MKLAEALHLRADLQKRIAQLGDRLNNNARVQEGDEPAEDPAVLLAELDADTAELARLITAINLTNSRTVSDGVTLTAMIAEKDALSLKISLLRNFIAQASGKVDRYSAKEIRICSTVNVRDEQKKLDLLSKTLRELDVKIQGLNWNTDLIE
ncbi:MAG: hypothetical protein E7662_13275 [Ruminococcaceae bacterium]|nr:hypothetical protein [Oscillospiraceae bacterium]